MFVHPMKRAILRQAYSCDLHPEDKILISLDSLVSDLPSHQARSMISFLLFLGELSKLNLKIGKFYYFCMFSAYFLIFKNANQYLKLVWYLRNIPTTLKRLS